MLLVHDMFLVDKTREGVRSKFEWWSKA